MRSAEFAECTSIEDLIHATQQLIDSHFPKIKTSRRQKLRHRKKPMITSDILKSISHQNQLYAKYLKTKTRLIMKITKNIKISLRM